MNIHGNDCDYCGCVHHDECVPALKAEAIKTALAHIELFKMLGEAEDELRRKDKALRDVKTAVRVHGHHDDSLALGVNGIVDAVLATKPAKEDGNNG